ncbi:putative lipoprotein [Escherichia coli]|uniref:Putative lipoprotein n=1 Tax=Escherichia coli TaxID=562 RepID=A0A377BCW4_ECOLX|nr:putative lipoprotein [Escherichia coli]
MFTIINYCISKQGISASGARYTDGIYVFWSKGDEATVYKRDRIVLNNWSVTKIHSVEIFPGRRTIASPTDNP